jgi:hydrogenase maturation factor
LAGNTGWIGVDRGNGLRFVQEWTLGKFFGNVIIHSGTGIVKVDKEVIEAKIAPMILGTIVQIMLYYNQEII